MAENTVLTNAQGETFVYGYHKADTVPKFWRDKYEKEAHKYWDKFYKKNSTHFFKDRHWIDREFEELRGSASGDSAESISTVSTPTVHALEVGCGVGNTVFPLLVTNPNLFFFAVDFSPHAIKLLKENSEYISTGRCSGHVVDMVNDPLPSEIAPQSLDIVMMIFVLSAISPQHFDTVIAKLSHVVKPGGCILFRDYALGDLAQQRFDGKETKPQKIEENFYVRYDGTRAYYFSEEYLTSLMARNGFETRECKIVEKVVENRKQGSEMKRLWIQGKFVRTSSESTTSSTSPCPISTVNQ